MYFTRTRIVGLRVIIKVLGIGTYIIIYVEPTHYVMKIS